MKIATSRIGKLVRGKGKQEAAQARPGTERSRDTQIYAQRVERKAYELYEKRGCQHGCDWQDWFEAERIVEQQMISGQ